MNADRVPVGVCRFRADLLEQRDDRGEHSSS
jgi:hypothetical protein